MEFAILGPVEVRLAGQMLLLGGPKQRALLAILLLHRNEVVSRDRLIDRLWGESAPPTARRSLDTYVSRLRTLLGAERIVRRAPGYLVRVEPNELDLDRFEALVERARESSTGGDSSAAAGALSEALSLWRGAALADLLYEPFVGREAERLEEQRLLAVEERIAAELELGGGAELVAELESLVHEHPFRERLLAQLMLALYRAGRQSQALAAYQTGRQRLARELGLEPGPELRELQREILEHDSSLGPPRRTSTALRPRSWLNGRRLATAAVAAAVAASAAVGIVLGTGGSTASSVDAASSGLVSLSSDSGAPGPGVALPGVPTGMAAAAGSLWLVDPNAATVSRFDLASHSIIDRVPVGGSPGAVAAGGGSIWATSVPGETITRIDPGTGTITQTVPLGGARSSALAFGGGGLWIADTVGNSLIELDPGQGTAGRSLTLPFRPTALAISGGAIWVAGYDASSVAEVELRTGQTVATVHVGNGPVALAAGLGAIWVANSLDSTVSRIDPASDSVVATIPVGSAPTAIAVAGGSVWVANQYSASISRIDPKRDGVIQTAPLGGSPTALAAADGTIWVGVRPLAQHRGGTLVLLHTRPISIDPALNADLLPPVSEGLTRDGLVTYNHVSGPDAIQLVPDLAVGLPAPTDGGTTYTFRLRSGIRYSDGRLLRAADFRRAIERLFRLGSADRALFDGIRGAESCTSTHCDLSPGIVTEDAARTVNFHLRAPDPDFLNSLAEHGFATAVPAGTPFRDTGFDPIPGTGPYGIASASEHEVRYVRNPFFHEWSHAAQPDGNPDQIVLRFGLTPEQEVRAIQEGRADWLADSIPARLVPILHMRYASRLHSFSIPTTDFFQINTTLPPFDDIRARQALNLALDRREIVRIYGGADLATPTCQILPPGIPGYRRYCPYTRNPGPLGTWTAPDLTRARRLVAASGTRGTPVTVWGWTDDPTISPRVVEYTADVLRRLGYPTRVHLVPHAALPKRATPIQLIAAGWGDTPYGFFSTWFSCGGQSNHGFFCDPQIDRAILRARASAATSPQAAAAAWARIDRELVDRALWVPFIDERAIDFVSARVRNYQSHPYWGVLADQLWVG